MNGFFGVVLLVAVVIAGFFGFYYLTSWDRVDPGDIGILVHYDTGKIEPVTSTQWIWITRYSKLFKYSGKEQTYIMDDNPAEGQMKGPDSIQCLTKDTQTLRIDVAVNWRVDPANVVDMYRLRQGVPLTGPLNRDAPGNFIEDLVVRPDSRSIVISACSHFGWEDILGAKRDEFASEIEKGTQTDLLSQSILVRSVVVRQARPSDALLALMNARLEGQKQREASDFAAAQAQRQAQITLDTNKAKSASDLVNTNAKAAQDIAAAEAANKIKLENADAQAQETQKLGEAQASANRAVANSLTGTFVEHEKWSRWDGKLPATTYGNDPSVQVQAK